MQTHSRRGFIGTCAAALAALGFGPSRSFGSEALGMADFAAMVRSSFYFANSAGTAYGRVYLFDVEEVSTDGGVSQFDLHFRGRRNGTMPEGLYSVTNWSGYPNFDVHVQVAGVDRRRREHYIANFALIQ